MMDITKKIYGVAGGISCGKTTFCRRVFIHLNENNIPCSTITIDNIRRYILYKSKELSHYKARTALKKNLNLKEDKNNFFDKNNFGRLIFSDNKKMEIYKEIINPEIILTIQGLIEKTAGIILIEWAMFIEDGMLALSNNNVILFEESKEIQYQRLFNGGLTNEEVDSRIIFTNGLGVRRRSKLVQEAIIEKGYGELILLKPDITKLETQKQIPFIFGL